jgi:CHAD domain-containing protein
MALEQIDKAVEHLAEPENRDEAIHEARKCFKKVRALLRLVRDELGEDVYQTENHCFRQAGRILSEVRSSQVLIDTLDALLEPYDKLLVVPAFHSVRQALVAQHESTVQQVLEDHDAVGSVIDILGDARQRVSTWSIGQTDFDAFRPGLQRVYKRGRKAMVAAYAEPSAAAFHEWRKRVKYLWYHLRVLRMLWPGMLSPLASELHRLADLLGDEHDQAELKQTLQTLPALDYRAESVRLLFSLIWQERNALQVCAHELGRRIYAETPSDFVERMASYWQIGQDC